MKAVFVFGVLVAAGVFFVRRQQPWVDLYGDLAALETQFAAVAASAGDAILEAIGMRGIRNKNPGNIRRSGITWQGQAATQTDQDFVQFISPEYGIRALSRVLDSYSQRHGLNTVGGIIARYAPSTENNTAAYASAVASVLGVGVNDAIDVQARKSDLVRAIIKHENGIQPYSLATIEGGILAA